MVPRPTTAIPAFNKVLHPLAPDYLALGHGGKPFKPLKLLKILFTTTAYKPPPKPVVTGTITSSPAPKVRPLQEERLPTSETKTLLSV
ncbi:hypothetical protein BJ508DRAFT_3567 [Ascobolus immersus RN42]|uniref:Uncharacterized protein n=1 Tax=Ascobolus immersus RN42 TaxID=1160509 RepID=A0A3N4IVD8_ASCIM|nr:hypothetical protein BJ508DRAFT_3567 [Ascobolus immersus RN42]